jgi:hypothetical protein
MVTFILGGTVFLDQLVFLLQPTGRGGCMGWGWNLVVLIKRRCPSRLLHAFFRGFFAKTTATPAHFLLDKNKRKSKREKRKEEREREREMHVF